MSFHILRNLLCLFLVLVAHTAIAAKPVILVNLERCVFACDSTHALVSIKDLTWLHHQQSKAIVIGISTMKPAQHVACFNFLKKQGVHLGSSKLHLEFKQHDALYARGVLYLPNLETRKASLQEFKIYVESLGHQVQQVIHDLPDHQIKPIYAVADHVAPDWGNLVSTQELGIYKEKRSEKKWRLTTAKTRDEFVKHCLTEKWVSLINNTPSAFFIYNEIPHKIFDDHCGFFCLEEVQNLPENQDTQGFFSFSEMTSLTLNAEVVNLLGKSKEFMGVTQKICGAMNYPETAKILEMIEERFLHLETLVNVQKGVYVKDANPFAKTTSHDAAGVLIYADYQGKPHLLLGLRYGEETYCNLGGSANVRESFVDTARREVREESGDGFDFPHLMYAPSHDVVHILSTGLLKRYRTYLVKTKHVDPAKILARIRGHKKYTPEYSKFVWVPVDDVMSVKLYPPLRESLASRPIQHWLSCLVKGEKIPDTCTQSIVGKPDLVAVESVVHAPTQQRQRFAHAMGNLAATREIIWPDSDGDDLYTVSASEHMRTHCMQNVDTSYSYAVQDILQSSGMSRKLDQIIQEEKKHKGIVFYHGLQSKIWFYYRILSLIRHQLDGTPIQTDVLRALDKHYEAFPDISHLRNFVESGRDNYSDGYKRAALSCNPTLYSGANDSGCFTPYYFLFGCNVSPPVNLTAILEDFLNRCGVSSVHLLKQFEAIYDRFFAENKGALLQFFMAPECVKQFCYISQTRGILAKDEQNVVITDARTVLEKLKRGEVTDHNAKYQVRLLLDFHRLKLGQLVVNDYFSKSVDIQGLDRAILALVKPYFPAMVHGLMQDEAAYGSGQPQTIQAARNYQGVTPAERNLAIDDIMKAYFADDVVGLFHALKAFGPGWREIIYYYPDSCEALELVKKEGMEDLANLDDVPADLNAWVKKHTYPTGMYNRIPLYVALARIKKERETKLDFLVKHKIISERMGCESITKVLSAVAVLGDDWREVLTETFENFSIFEDDPIVNALLNRERGDYIHAMNQLGAARKKVAIRLNALGLLDGNSHDGWHLLSCVYELGDQIEACVEFAKPIWGTKKYNGKIQAAVLRAVHLLGEEAEDVIKATVSVMLHHYDALVDPDSFVALIPALQKLGKDRTLVINAMHKYLKRTVYAYEDYTDTIRCSGEYLVKIIEIIHGYGHARERKLQLLSQLNIFQKNRYIDGLIKDLGNIKKFEEEYGDDD